MKHDCHNKLIRVNQSESKFEDVLNLLLKQKVK